MVANSQVIILIDCGATHNFVAIKIVANLHLPLSETSNSRVVMGNGEAIKGENMQECGLMRARTDGNGRFHTLRIERSGFYPQNAVVVKDGLHGNRLGGPNHVIQGGYRYHYLKRGPYTY